MEETGAASQLCSGMLWTPSKISSEIQCLSAKEFGMLGSFRPGKSRRARLERIDFSKHVF